PPSPPLPASPGPPGGGRASCHPPTSPSSGRNAPPCPSPANPARRPRPRPVCPGLFRDDSASLPCRWDAARRGRSLQWENRCNPQNPSSILHFTHPLPAKGYHHATSIVVWLAPGEGVHADRVTAGDCHHRHPHRPPPPRRAKSPRGRRPPPLSEQPQTDWHRPAQLPRRQQRPASGEDQLRQHLEQEPARRQLLSLQALP